jgi:EipB-like
MTANGFSPTSRKGRPSLLPGSFRALVLAAALTSLPPPAPALQAAAITPHRALYSLSLGTMRSGLGLVEASGTMAYEWGDACDGWTIEQRYRLSLGYGEKPDEEIRSSFVTWEAKNGLRYRFNQKETHNGKNETVIRGAAILEGPGKGGVALYSKPHAETIALPPGVLFPSAHTILLIDEARRGETLVVRRVFDGTSEENASEVSAVISRRLAAPLAAAAKSPLLDRPGWRIQLAFFPADPEALTPDYEIGMDLLDNGVSRNLSIDYGDYTIRGTLKTIDPLPRPSC